MFDFLTKALGFGGSGGLGAWLNVAKLGMDVAGSIKGYTASKKAAEQATASIMANQAANTAALAERDAQQQSQAKEDMSERARKAMIEKARMKAIAAEAGVNWDEGLARDANFGAGTDIATITANAEGASRQTRRELARLNAQTQSQMNQVRAPSFLDLALGLGGAAMGAADRGRRMKASGVQIWP